MAAAAAAGRQHGRRALASAAPLARRLSETKVLPIEAALTDQRQDRRKSAPPFGFAWLSSPDQVLSTTRAAAAECRRMVAEIKDPSTPPLRMLYRLDDISNTLCIVADAAEAYRSLLPTSPVGRAAAEARVTLGDLMEELNVDPGLAKALEASQAHWPQWTVDESRAASEFLREFRAAGSHLPPALRQRYRRLRHDYMRAIQDLYSLPLHRAEVTLPGGGGSHAMLVSPISQPDMSSYPEDVRRAVFEQTRMPPDHPVHAIIDRILRARHEVAALSGHSSYAELTCRTQQLAFSAPADILAMLDDTVSALGPSVRTINGVLGQIKKALDGTDRMRAWDVGWGVQQLTRELRLFDAAAFDVRDVLMGTDALVHRLFGIRLRCVPVAAGEAPDASVFKVLAVDATTDEPLGIVYCDLFARQGKEVPTAVSTLQCGRRDADGSRQLAVAMLTMNHAPAKSWSIFQVTDFMHELGHALHVVCYDGRFQAVSGTRTAADFVETPSTLMEFFLRDYEVIKLLAPAWNAKVHRHVTHARQLLAPLSASDIAGRAIADQHLHGGWPLREDPRLITMRAHARALQYEWDERQLANMSLEHLDSYGATFYSYLQCQGNARQLWAELFQGDALSPQAGARLRKHLLTRGGANSSEAIMTATLGKPLEPHHVGSRVAAEFDEAFANLRGHLAQLGIASV